MTHRKNKVNELKNLLKLILDFYTRRDHEVKKEIKIPHFALLKFLNNGFDISPSQSSKIRNMVKHFKKYEGKGLIIFGESGSGKTLLLLYTFTLFLYKIYKSEIASHRAEKPDNFDPSSQIFLKDIYWVDSVRCINSFKLKDIPSIEKILERPILFFDNLDILKRENKEERRILKDVIISRYDYGLCSFITTDMKLITLYKLRKNFYFRQFCERLLDKERFLRIFIEGGSKRKV